MRQSEGNVDEIVKKFVGGIFMTVFMHGNDLD